MIMATVRMYLTIAVGVIMLVIAIAAAASIAFIAVDTRFIAITVVMT